MKINQKPEAVLLDFGDTILETTKFNPLGGTKHVIEFFDNPKNITPNTIQKYSVNLYKNILKSCDLTTFEFNCEAFSRLLYERFEMKPKVSYAEINKEFWNNAFTFAPMPGIYDFLNFLDSNKIKKAIFSNTMFPESIIRDELNKFDLGKRFSFIMTSCDYGFKKPNKIIFELALIKLNSSPENCWYVGDRIEYDVQGALNTGMIPIHFKKDSKPEIFDNYIQIGSWSDAIEILS